MQLRQQIVIWWNRLNGFKHYWAKAACLLMKYFLLMDFIVTLIHCVTYQDVSHFSKSEHIWIFRVNCNISLKDDLVKPLLVQKSVCLQIRPLNYPENKGNGSLHPSLSPAILLNIFITSTILNIMTKVKVLVFQFLTARTETLVWRHQEWRHTVWRHVVAFTLCLDCVNKTAL